ncbi:MAG: UbiD family decarboxylase, partial [Chloroflexi bacterium]|nr:UbiD family decarboxylase [Chloroflexota bacterium]
MTTSQTTAPTTDGVTASTAAFIGQQSLADFVNSMERAGMLTRIAEPTRVDQIAQLLQANPRQAVLIEKVVDSEFQFLANAYSNQDQYAWSLGCTKAETGRRLSELAQGRVKWETVDTAPCKDVILKGDDVDLTRLPQFLYHERDGHAYTTDNFVVSKHPDTGIYDWGIYRSMFRTTTEKNCDMTCTSHRQRLHGLAARAKGQNLQLAVVIGVPLLDHLAGLQGVPDTTDDFEVLGSFYGHPAKLVKCETLDLLVPANAEIVLEG